MTEFTTGAQNQVLEYVTYNSINDGHKIVDYMKGHLKDGNLDVAFNSFIEAMKLYYEASNVEHKEHDTIKVKYFSNDIEEIQELPNGDWIDLRAAENIELKAFEFKLIPLGIGMILPEGYEANIVPRSSTFKNFGIIQTNHFAVIDNSYSGDNDQWFYPVLALRDTVINKGDRICQFRLNKKMDKLPIIKVEKLNNINRGGLGSSGVK